VESVWSIALDRALLTCSALVNASPSWLTTKDPIGNQSFQVCKQRGPVPRPIEHTDKLRGNGIQVHHLVALVHDGSLLAAKIRRKPAHPWSFTHLCDKIRLPGMQFHRAQGITMEQIGRQDLQILLPIRLLLVYTETEPLDRGFHIGHFTLR
jgi:hypothetical protein